MKLTGKCKEDFDKWLNLPALTGDVHNFKVIIGLNKFNDLTDSMKYGVYVDFFDSAGINIASEIDSCANDYMYLSVVNFKTIDAHESRQEARIAAIEKANELYNNIK